MRSGTWLAGVRMVGIMLCWSAYGQTSTSTPAPQGIARVERELFAAVNQARRVQGLSALRWDESLAAAARRHAEVMLEHGSTGHAFAGEPSLSMRAKQAGVHFGWLSENVMQGPSAEFIHEQFMKSAPHRANILDREMDSIGAGVVEQGGELFVVEDFAQER
jgi:uncharacterized protein YkwD